MPVVKYNSFSESCSGRIFSCQDVGQLFAVCMKSWQDGVRQEVGPSASSQWSVVSRCAGFGDTRVLLRGARPQMAFFFFHELNELTRM